MKGIDSQVQGHRGPGGGGGGGRTLLMWKRALLPRLHFLRATHTCCPGTELSGLMTAPESRNSRSQQEALLCKGGWGWGRVDLFCIHCEGGGGAMCLSTGLGAGGGGGCWQTHPPQAKPPTHPKPKNFSSREKKMKY